MVERRPMAFGKSNLTLMCFCDFCKSFLPERIFQIAARRTVSGTSQGETKSGAVTSGDMILVAKRVRSLVAATLRSPFRQKEPTSARTAIRHGFVRVLKMLVVVRFPRRADACRSPVLSFMTARRIFRLAVFPALQMQCRVRGSTKCSVGGIAGRTLVR